MSKRTKQLACPNAVFWSRADVLAATSLSESAIKRKIEAGEFPRSVSIGKRRVAWQREDILSWCAARVAAARNND